MKQLSLAVIICIFFSFNLNAQSTSFKYYTLSNAFKNSLFYIKCLSDSVARSTDDSTKLFANAKLRDTLPGLLRVETTFEDPFDSIKSISIIKSNDEHVRIYTWFVATENATKYQYEGVIQFRDKGDKLFKVISLRDSTYEDDLVIKKLLKKGNWYGAMYYNIIEVRKNGNTLYTLIGWKGYDKNVTKKVIDIVKFTRGEPTFGAAVLQNKKKIQSRLIFSYSSAVSMKLNYDPKKKMIVYEHLSAPDGTENAAPEVMGPDMTYDGLKWRDEKWMYFKDLEMKNNSTESDKKDKPDKKEKKLYTPASEEGEKK